jgi:hypothetical protein
MVFGLESKRPVAYLRNFIAFCLRSSIHKHRNFELGIPKRAQEPIFLASKRELKDDLKIKFLTGIGCRKTGSHQELSVSDSKD